MKAKLLYAHLCDMAFLSKDENVNVIGMFRQIVVKKLPVVHPKMSCVACIQADVMAPFKIQILKREAKEVIARIEARPRQQDQHKDSQTYTFHFLNDFLNTRFDAAGAYLVEIWFGDQLLGDIPFDIHLLEKRA